MRVDPYSRVNTPSSQPDGNPQLDVNRMNRTIHHQVCREGKKMIGDFTPTIVASRRWNYRWF